MWVFKCPVLKADCLLADQEWQGEEWVEYCMGGNGGVQGMKRNLVHPCNLFFPYTVVCAVRDWDTVIFKCLN
jgi:hypothetical protein